MFEFRREALKIRITIFGNSVELIRYTRELRVGLVPFYLYFTYFDSLNASEYRTLGRKSLCYYEDIFLSEDFKKL